MYSIVMLTAMTATAEAPSLGDFWSKHCFWECCWPARYGWVPCGGGLPYYPTPYYACHGCGHFIPHHHHACHGCAGWSHGCAGWGHWGHGCAGWGHGGCWSPHYNCYGGGAGAGLYAGIGYSGFGAYGNFGNYGMFPYIGAPAFAPPIVNVRPVDGAGLETKPIPPPTLVKPLVDLGVNNSASILVKVPADAKVFIDNYQMKSTSTERLFTSPELVPGKSYFYTIRVLIEKDGKLLEESRKVLVHAGETSRLAFDNLDKPRDDGRAIVDATKP